ncbi:malectin domain-containing carbohydrate-binding protein [Luteococcus sp. OSA5]|uniref:malectin domain-containing carbohydrate-binding protein n=1 Tax=Luteococcus sp. OSA5 TaxID=3401630 RepID=UPI003B43C958
MQSLARRAVSLTSATVCSVLLLALSPACGVDSFNFQTVAADKDVTDQQDGTWRSRAGLEGGSGFSNKLQGKPIKGAKTPEAFTTNVWGEHSYRIPVPEKGTYTVSLYAAEDYFTKPGERIFHVDAEGRRAASDLDIYAAVGHASAFRHQFKVEVTDGTLDLDLGGDVNHPLVSALRVESGPGDSTDPIMSPEQQSSPKASQTPSPSGARVQATGHVNRSGRAVGFAPNSFWFEDISKAPLASNSRAQAADLAKQVSDKYGGIAAFNAHQYNVALETVGPEQATTDVKWVDCQGKGSLPANIYTGEAYFKNVPMPASAAPAVGKDGQLSIYQPSTDKLWEFWQAKKTGKGWQACWGGRMDDVSKNRGMFKESYGVSATNIALAGGMVTLEDVRRGKINHALSLAIVTPAPHDQISWPAQRSDGAPQSKGLIREGQRLRLDPNLDLDKYDLTPMARMIAEAAQTYGFIITDKSGAVAIPTESGYGVQAKTGKNPWDEILGGTPDYMVLKNFPWDKTQFLPVDHGKP